MLDVLDRCGLRVHNEDMSRDILRKFFEETDVLTDMILHVLHEDEVDHGAGKNIDNRGEEQQSGGRGTDANEIARLLKEVKHANDFIHEEESRSDHRKTAGRMNEKLSASRYTNAAKSK